MKILTPDYFASIAVSKDPLRGALTSLYRDEDRLVGCDGHRLHMVTSLPEVTPHVVNGAFSEYPNYKRVLPQGDCIYFDIEQNPKMHRDLKRIVTLLKGYDPKHLCCKLCAKDCFLKLHISTAAFDLNYTLTATDKEIEATFLNLGYLTDALTLLNHEKATIVHYGTTKPLMVYSGRYQAIVMPQKAPK